MLQIQQQLFLENEEFTKIYNERKQKYLETIRETLSKNVLIDNFFEYKIEFENFSANFRFTFETQLSAFGLNFIKIISRGLNL